MRSMSRCEHEIYVEANLPGIYKEANVEIAWTRQFDFAKPIWDKANRVHVNLKAKTNQLIRKAFYTILLN